MPNKSFENFKVSDYLKNEIMETKAPYLKSENGFDISIVYRDDIEIEKMTYSAILDECKQNIWFFFREVARVPSIYNKYGDQFKLTPISFALIQTYKLKCNFVASSIFEDSQMHQTLILLALYEYISGYPSRIHNFINTFINKESFKHLQHGPLINEIRQYAKLLIPALPIFINFNNTDTIRIVTDEFNAASSILNTAISNVEVTDKIDEILNQNLYVYRFTDLSDEYQFFLLECCAKYQRQRRNKKDYKGKFIFEIDFRNMNLKSPTSSYIQYMILRLESNEFITNTKYVDFVLREAHDNGNIVHIAESIEPDSNDYQGYKSNAYLSKIKSEIYF